MRLALHHIALGAEDVSDLAAFYADLFSLNEVARHHAEDGTLRSIWLELADGDRDLPLLLMIERTTEPPRPISTGRGPFLLAFRVAVEERGRFEARLEGLGVSVESRTAFSSYFRDPEGNRFAISHYPER